MAKVHKWHQFELDTQPLKAKRNQTFFDYVYNGETGEFLGRTPESWGKIILFYIIFYAILASIFAICMVTFHQQFINPRVPRLQQEYSIIGTSPGLGFRPLPPDVRSTLIWYKGTSPESYRYWEEQLMQFLTEYKEKGKTAGTGENIFNCGYGKRTPHGRVCDFNIQNLKPCTQENHFNYHKSSPCVFLKLNKIYGWTPEPLDVDDLPYDMPMDLQRHIKNVTSYNPSHAYQVWVSCEGETPADKENIGTIKYLPDPGFPGYFYPYENAEGYQSPLVAVNFVQPRNLPCRLEAVPVLELVVENAVGGIIINVECRAWAKNIIYNKKERMGFVHFELMLE